MSDRCREHQARCCQTCEPRCDHQGCDQPAVALIANNSPLTASEYAERRVCRWHGASFDTTPADAGSTPPWHEAETSPDRLFVRCSCGTELGTWQAYRAHVSAALAEHDRQTAAKALRDAAYDMRQFEPFPGEEPDWLEERADRIEGDR